MFYKCIKSFRKNDVKTKELSKREQGHPQHQKSQKCSNSVLVPTSLFKMRFLNTFSVDYYEISHIDCLICLTNAYQVYRKTNRQKLKKYKIRKVTPKTKNNKCHISLLSKIPYSKCVFSTDTQSIAMKFGIYIA